MTFSLLCAAAHNKNGTFDLGVMQINSRWVPTLAHYGYTKVDIQFNPCLNVKIGTWLIAKGLAEEKNFWSGIGNYHSHTPIDPIETVFTKHIKK